MDKNSFRKFLPEQDLLALYIASSVWVTLFIVNLFGRITHSSKAALFLVLFTFAGYIFLFPISIFLSLRAWRKKRGNSVNIIGSLVLTVPPFLFFIVALTSTLIQLFSGK